MPNDIMRVRSWTRVEPHARNTDMSTTLAAEVCDPLWFLARQWQLGELTGSDGGSPILADVSSSWSRLTRLQPGGSTADSQTTVIGPNTPLEALVEGERELWEEGAWAPRLRAGRDFGVALEAAGLSGLIPVLTGSLTTAFTAQRAEEDAPSDIDDCYAALTAGQTVIDGGKVLALLMAGGLPEDLVAGLGSEERNALTNVTTTWKEQMSRKWGIAGTGAARNSTSWRQDCLDYAFTLAAPPLPGTEAPVVLEATGYNGAGLTWHSVDLVPSPGDAPDPFTELSAEEDQTDTRLSTVMPATVGFPGSAADRYWEFEDAAVSFGATAPSSTDLVQMLAVEFGVAYSPDWLLIPVDLPVGTVTCVDWVIIRDTFGTATIVGTRASQRLDGHGRLFQPHDDATEGDHPMLALFESPLGQQVSAQRESIHFRRDEMANIAWAIERVVAGRAGRGSVRQYSSTDFQLPDPPSDLDPAELVYRLATKVPRNWIPLVAQATGALRKGRVLDTQTATTVSSSSQLLSDLKEVPGHVISHLGTDVTTTDQMCRTADGNLHVWRGRTRRSGSGEVTSGLTFDVTEGPK